MGVEHGVGGGVGDDFHGVALLHEGGAGDEFFADGDLLEGLVVHEDVGVALGVEVLVGAALYAYVLELLADVEAAFEHSAVDDVLELGAHEGVALAGFYVQELHAEIEAAVHADAGAVFDVLSVNHCCV